MFAGKQLLIIGAGGHGRVAADIARLMGFDVSFLDDKGVPGMPVIGSICDFHKYLSNASFFVAIGNNEVRRRILTELFSASADVVTLIHPNAVIAADTAIGKGSIVMAGAVINSGTRIGEGVIVNTCSSVDHDCMVEDYVHVSIGCRVAGSVVIREKTFVGAGAVVANNLTICSNCVIGAGTVVLRDIPNQGTYVGIPARQVH